MKPSERKEFIRMCRKLIQVETVLERIAHPGRYCAGRCRCNDAEVFKKMARKALAHFRRT